MNPVTYKVVIKNNTETWYDANRNRIYFKNSDGFERWWEYYGSNGNQIHFKNSDGYEYWCEYDANGKKIHVKDSNGFEVWYDSKGNEISKKEFNAIHSSCHGKVIEVDGKKYQLTAI